MDKRETARWLHAEHHTLNALKDRLSREAEGEGDQTAYGHRQSRRIRQQLYRAADAVDDASDAVETILDTLDQQAKAIEEAEGVQRLPAK